MRFREQERNLQFVDGTHAYFHRSEWQTMQTCGESTSFQAKLWVHSFYAVALPMCGGEEWFPKDGKLIVLMVFPVQGRKFMKNCCFLLICPVVVNQFPIGKI